MELPCPPVTSPPISCVRSPREAGIELLAGHAHELVAAFFGYPTASALQAETEYPLEELDQAKFMVADLALMDQRRAQLVGLPSGLPSSDEMARALADHYRTGHFRGIAWVARDLAEQVQIYIDENPLLIEDDLGGPMAETNAYFDELYVPDASVDITRDAIIAEASGSLNGTNDEDRAFSRRLDQVHQHPHFPSTFG
jgi:hypothetical protein